VVAQGVEAGGIASPWRLRPNECAAADGMAGERAGLMNGMRRYGRAAKRRLLSSHPRAAFFRFACVGLAMAVVDISLLYLLKDQNGFNSYTARLLSYSAGLMVGYVLNRNFTFHHVDSDRHVVDEFARFLSVHLTGGLLNLGIYSLVMLLAEGADLSRFWHAVMPLLGVWLGGVVGMCFNFLLSRRLVFDD
jgi:putative flippase GtrA